MSEKEKTVGIADEILAPTSTNEGSLGTTIVEEKKKGGKKPKGPSVSVFRLFRFASFSEKIMIIIALICSIGSGSLQPVSILIYGNFINNLAASLNDTSKLLENTLPIIRIMAYMGTASLLSAYIASVLWIRTGENQTRRIRSLYLHSVLRQDMSWFDNDKDGSLNTRLASDTQLIQDGISEKFGQFVTLMAQFIAGFVVAFIKGWRMALIMLAVLPLLFITFNRMFKYITKYSGAVQETYAQAGAIAEQAFQSIRTVYAFTLQDRFSERYAAKLDEACKFGIKRGITLGVGFASIMSLNFFGFGLGLWYGSKLVVEGKITGPSVFVVFLAMMMGTISFLKLPPNLAPVFIARGAAYKIYEIIDRVPDIDPDSTLGLMPNPVKGSIEFKNVHFTYPTRPDLVILDELSLKIEPGMSVAFVGPSGSGKSTTIQLIQRFYDAVSGVIKLDGHDIKDLNVRWLRQQIGVVSQEPVLFNMTIRQNLLMGVEEAVAEEAVIAACKEANCHTFITQLPNGYDTLVGEQGGMLSGGQKQRIAIARAILKNPTILLLDEATSALDTHSERLVQNALDKASANRTTIVVAHRLSTIMSCDKIVVLDHGSIIESGTHQELINLNGVYADLVQKQAINIEESGLSETVKSTNLNAEDLLIKEQLEIKQQLEEDERNQKEESDLTNSATVDIEEGTDTSKKVEINAHAMKLEDQKRRRKIMKKQNAPISKVFHRMRPEWKYLFVGLCGSALAGCVFPLYAFSFSHIVTILSVPGQEIQPSPLGGTNLYAFLFLILGLCAGIGNLTQHVSYETCGELFSKRFRLEVFNSYLKQEVGFFDKEENNTGSLTTKLAVDARNVTELVTKVWGDLAQLTATVIIGLAIAFSYSWALTLITLCMAPFITLATAYEFRVQKGFEDETKKAYAESGQVAGEAIREVRTVASLNKQSHFEKTYYTATDHPHKLAIKKSYTASVAAGFSKGITIYTSCIAFFAGAHLIQSGSITFQEMFTSMTVVMTTSEAVGRLTTFISTYSKAKFAALASFEVIERQSKIDPDLEGIEPNHVTGSISYKDIKFAYPARPDNTIFNGNFSLDGIAGQTIALVGPSGCGKSTTIGMIQRWYDPMEGTVNLDEKDINGYSLYNLRSHMALVGQEPVLFDMTIGENIRFGIVSGKEVTQEEVEEACMSSNIHGFVISLPLGYDTRVGDKGSQLSGGQKQRIAIARALIRKPRLLLLDEATSALDSDSERLVQEALDNILEEGGRTTITIAHRLSTIQNADNIIVVKDGEVKEIGTHFELLKLNGTYSDMVHQQSLSVL